MGDRPWTEYRRELTRVLDRALPAPAPIVEHTMRSLSLVVESLFAPPCLPALTRARYPSDHSSESADSNPLGLRAGSSVSHRRRLVRGEHRPPPPRRAGGRGRGPATAAGWCGSSTAPGRRGGGVEPLGSRVEIGQRLSLSIE